MSPSSLPPPPRAELSSLARSATRGLRTMASGADLEIGWWMDTSFVPSGKVPSTCTSSTTLSIPSCTWRLPSILRPRSMISATLCRGKDGEGEISSARLLRAAFWRSRHFIIVSGCALGGAHLAVADQLERDGRNEALSARSMSGASPSGKQDDARRAARGAPGSPLH